MEFEELMAEIKKFDLKQLSMAQCLISIAIAEKIKELEEK